MKLGFGIVGKTKLFGRQSGQTGPHDLPASAQIDWQHRYLQNCNALWMPRWTAMGNVFRDGGKIRVPLTEVSGVTAFEGGGAKFVASNGLVEDDASFVIRPMSSCTYAAWFKCTAESTTNPLFFGTSSPTTSARLYGIAVYTTRRPILYYRTGTETTTRAYSTVVLEVGRWYFVVAGISSGALGEIWVNGISTVGASTATFASAGFGTVGGCYNGTETWLPGEGVISGGIHLSERLSSEQMGEWSRNPGQLFWLPGKRRIFIPLFKSTVLSNNTIKSFDTWTTDGFFGLMGGKVSTGGFDYWTNDGLFGSINNIRTPIIPSIRRRTRYGYNKNNIIFLSNV